MTEELVLAASRQHNSSHAPSARRRAVLGWPLRGSTTPRMRRVCVGVRCSVGRFAAARLRHQVGHEP